MSEPVESQTRGFLFADLRGYTQFVEAHGDQAGAELLARYRVLVREVIARFHGAEIKTEGDSFYVVFSSASAAVQGGRAILDAAAAAGSGPGTAEIRVGIGVHAGETAETPEGFVGSAINLAARICALAGPGELLVSDTVRSLTRTFLGLQFVPRGRQRLKGIEEPVLVYQVLPSAVGLAGGASGNRARWKPRRSRALTAAAIGLPVMLVAGIVLFGAPGTRPGGTGLSPSATSALPSGVPSSGAPSTPSLTADEQKLLEKLPGAMRGDCSSASAADGSAGGSVSLHCRLALGAAADEVWVDEFPTPPSLAGALSEAVARQQAPTGDCKTTPLANQSWAVPNVRSGKLLCYARDGAAWLVWTYDLERILVMARRGGGDWMALYAWWHETAPFLR